MSLIATIGGASYPAVPFKAIGDPGLGRIVGFEDYQESEFADDPARGVRKGDPKVYPKSGDPVMGTKIHLETIPGDETSRVTLYAQGKRLLAAIAGAVRATGAQDLEIGGDLAVTFTGYDGRAKTYQASYSRPEVKADVPF